jgi:phi13 family phage major tail protein
MSKTALKGFSKVTLFPLTANTTAAYTVDDAQKYPLPNVQSMTQDVDVSESKVYADDAIYQNVKSWNGIKATITVADLDLATMGKLGVGSYNVTTKEFTMDPEAAKPELGMSFACQQTDGQYRMYHMYVFQVEEVREAEHKTMGDNTDIQPYQIIGTFTKRKVDNKPGAIKLSEGGVITWLNDIPDKTA